MKENSENLPDNPEMRELARLQAQMLRPAQNVNRDGSFEVGWGIALLCFGVVPYFNAVVAHWTWFSPWVAWLGFLPLICAAFAPYAVPKMIKRFITWPRTGYVAYPNDVKLTQLLLLMAFGCALGGSIGLLFILVVEAREVFDPSGAPGDLHKVALMGIYLLVCAALVAYLAPKVIRKRPPLPMAYDAAVLTQALQQTAPGQKRLSLMRFTWVGVFVGLSIFVACIVFGLMYWNKSLMHHPDIHWSQLGMPSFLVASNALLYFMGSGLVLKPHRWKWFVLPVMLFAPILIAPAIPYLAAQAGIISTWAPLPPVMLCLGTVWLFSGAIALILFMRHNPLPSEATP